MESLKGRLLISAGGLYDPNFRHTVVLIAAHDDEGAVGVILNRPLEMSIQDAARPLAAVAGPDAVLFEGGPVEPRQPVLMVEVDRPEVLDVRVFGGIGFLTGDVPPEVQPAILRARVFAGHAGWGPGQLEAELEADAWIVEEPSADDVFTASPETLWRRVLQRKGPPYDAVARIPFDPSMN